ncbi:hypothetical protein QJQ45_024275, partial [Haematococcus lacustris]
MPGRGGRRGGAPQATFAEQQLAEERASNGQAMYSGLNPASNGIRPTSAAPRPQNSRGIVGRPSSAIPAIATAAPITTSAAPRAPLSHNSNPSPSQAQPAQQQRQQQQQQQQRQQQPKAQQHAPAAEPAPRVEHGIPATHHIPVVALQHQSNTRFADLPVSDLTKRAMAEVFKYEYCTHVQSQALPACLAGGDVLAKAKTGTGKTIAFGIPVIETLLARPQPRGQVGALILSPTRELAYQIHAEFVKLLTFHKLSLQVMIGGTNLNSEASRLKKGVPDILVATPGRCLDHMTNEASQLQRYMSGCRVLVCDEADNLLDMGFKPTIERILNFLPPRGQRQALLFSATFPQDVQSLARFALNAPYTTVDTVGEETSTNVQVEQQEAVVPFEEQFAYLYASLVRHTKEDPEDYKVIVFFPTARQTQIYAEAFEAAGMPVLEIHSRKSQAQRTRVSDEFRRNSRVMMFSSDVSARGVDYPDVSLVVQVGAPSDKAQYVHRVGRTARAGKAGKALLMLCDFEADFRRQLKELPLVPAPALSPAEHRAATNAMATGLSRVSSETKSKAYVSWLGFYKSCPWVKMSPAQVVAQANNFATVMGCLEPPELQASTVGKMGLKATATATGNCCGPLPTAPACCPLQLPTAPACCLPRAYRGCASRVGEVSAAVAVGVAGEVVVVGPVAGQGSRRPMPAMVVGVPAAAMVLATAAMVEGMVAMVEGMVVALAVVHMVGLPRQERGMGVEAGEGPSGRRGARAWGKARGSASGQMETATAARGSSQGPAAARGLSAPRGRQGWLAPGLATTLFSTVVLSLQVACAHNR